MEYKEILQTKNVWKWINTREYICLHHTWTGEWTTKWNLNILLWKTDRIVSAHFLVSENWDKYKLANSNQITYHAGQSCWGDRTDMNRYSIGIEVVWWLWKPFTKEQRVSVRELIEHLMFTFKIPKENVLKHCDLTHWLSNKKIHWDYKSKSRKVDIAEIFFTAWWFKTWKEYQDSLVPRSL